MSMTTRTAAEHIWTAAESRPAVTIRVELIAYALLAVLALLLRLAHLDTVPLSPGEAHEALAAWRVLNPAPDVPVYAAQSQIVFLAQSLGFTLLGASEFSARFLTALAGALLVLIPLLFRERLGQARAFAMAALLAVSPVLLVASRESDVMVWAALFAAGMLWAVQAWTQRTEGDGASLAAVAAIFAVGLLFLSGSTGVVFAVIVGVAAFVTFVWDRPQTDDDGQKDLWASGASQRTFPWGTAILAAVAAILVGGTSFLLYPSGLSAVGNAFAGLGALIAPSTPPPTALHPLVVSLFHEPYLWIMGLVSIALLLRGAMEDVDRFFVLMTGLGAIAAIVFRGAGAAAAFWLTLPLAGLASRLLTACFSSDDASEFLPAPGWARWVVALGLIGALAVFTLAAQSLSRALTGAADGLLSSVALPSDSIVLFFVALMFILIGFFLFSSLWGARTTWQGIGIGVGVFFGLTSLGSGWQLAVSRGETPAQFWESQVTSTDTSLLRATLLELAKREGGGFPDVPVYAVAQPDGVVAWLLRDFSQTVFVRDYQEAIQQPVVMVSSSVTPDLGAGYVGQDFRITRTWTSSALRWVDLPAFWTQGLAGGSALSIFDDRIVLWLRQDIYAGVEGGLSGAG
ncbi:MAG: glycosyltransferase family 39 protein [Chloroflexi bacterium]|nr:glycosyltransferase family 39 protein [Chloroflexota bacterium]